ncbi:MAG: glycerophosphodiester phosphodiesterase family protein [Alistipes sp.]
MKIGKLFLTAVTFCSVASLQAQSGTQIVAHRGYWKTEGSAQNSIASLEKAIEIGCRGSEIDLILTTDGVLVLHHDDAIAGKRVDASTYAEIKDVKLSNGESLPTFDASSAVARRRKASRSSRSSPIRPRQKEDAAVLAALDAVRRAGMNKRVEYISFSKNICEQLIANGPKGIKVAYLGGDLSPRSSPSGDIPDSIIISARCGLMRSGSTRRGSWASRSMSGLSMTRDR